MAVQTSAGAKFYLGPANETADEQAEFEALSYTLVGEIEDIGEFGDRVNPVNFTALGDSRVRKFKGSRDAGNITMTVGFDPSDAGQSAIETALAADGNYAVRISLGDTGTGSPSNPTTFYFLGKVMSYTTNIGSADNVVRSTVEVAIDSAIVRVAAVSD